MDALPTAQPGGTDVNGKHGGVVSSTAATTKESAPPATATDPTQTATATDPTQTATATSAPPATTATTITPSSTAVATECTICKVESVVFIAGVLSTSVLLHCVSTEHMQTILFAYLCAMWFLTMLVSTAHAYNGCSAIAPPTATATTSSPTTAATATSPAAATAAATATPPTATTTSPTIPDSSLAAAKAPRLTFAAKECVLCKCIYAGCISGMFCPFVMQIAYDIPVDTIATVLGAHFCALCVLSLLRLPIHAYNGCPAAAATNAAMAAYFTSTSPAATATSSSPTTTTTATTATTATTSSPTTATSATSASTTAASTPRTRAANLCWLLWTTVLLVSLYCIDRQYAAMTGKSGPAVSLAECARLTSSKPDCPPCILSVSAFQAGYILYLPEGSSPTGVPVHLPALPRPCDGSFDTMWPQYDAAINITVANSESTLAQLTRRTADVLSVFDKGVPGGSYPACQEVLVLRHALVDPTSVHALAPSCRRMGHLLKDLYKTHEPLVDAAFKRSIWYLFEFWATMDCPTEHLLRSNLSQSIWDAGVRVTAMAKEAARLAIELDKLAGLCDSRRPNVHIA